MSRGEREIAPMYARLPRGPHQLDRGAVLCNQRERIQGALAEAIAGDGWERTSVSRVIALAGVSRRAFYEQFANREDCLLASSEQISGRCLAAARAAAEAASLPERRVRAVATVVAEAVQRSPAAASLAVCHCECAGRAGVACARRTASAWERLLADSLWPGGAGAPPAPMVRALVGGARAILRAHLCARGGPPPAAGAAPVRSQLLGWCAPLAGPVQDGLAQRIASASARSLRGRSRPPSARAGNAPSQERILRAALRLAVVADFAELTPAQIADEAEVPVEAVFVDFLDPAACFAAAQERVAAELLGALDGRGAGGAWATAGRAKIDRLLCHLQERPLSAHTIAHGAFAAGPAAVRRNHALALAVAERVLEGAGDLRPPVAVATAGALWHTIGCQVAGGGVQLLPALRDHLAYVVIASVSGADAAARALGDELPSGACG